MRGLIVSKEIGNPRYSRQEQDSSAKRDHER